MLGGMSEVRPVALVTGAARRVGRAIALRLAQAGFDVAFTYHHSVADAATLVAELEHLGRRALKVQCDLTRPQEAVDAVHSAFAQAFTRLHVLVNNASVYEPSSLSETTVEQMGRFWAVHVEAPLLLARAFDTFLRASRGHIVNMTDLMAERPGPAYLTYAASKAGLSSLTKGLARTLAPEVTVNAIAPGVVEWPKDYPQADRDQYLKRVPLARAGTPEDVAQTVLFLARSEGYITGQVLTLDGGRSVT
jgi:pteridine reductase